MENQINVAKTSTEGHFVKQKQPNVKVVCIDEINETYFVEGDATLASKNHQTLELESNCLLTPQQVYNPYKKMFEKSRD